MDRGEALHWWQTRMFVAAMAITAAIPLLWPDVPPLVDLPGHMGRYRIMLGTDADALSHWYRFVWRPIGNLGVDLMVFGLAQLVGLELAVKLVVIVIPITTVAGILWVSHEAHGRIQPWAIAALPLAYNYTFQFGFVNNALALALALNAFALWLRLGRTGRLRLRAILFAPIGLVVWTAHIVGWGVLGLLTFGSEIARLREAGARWLSALFAAAVTTIPLALPIILIIAWRSGDGVGETAGFFLWGMKLSWIGMTLRDRWLAFDLLSSIFLILLVYREWRNRKVAKSRALAFGIALLLAAFLVVPFMLLDSFYADMRLTPYLAMLALLALGADEGVDLRRQRIIAGLALAFVLVRTAGTTASYALYDHDWKTRLAALDHVPRAARVAAFVGEPCDHPWARARLTHLAGMAIVRRAVFTNDQWRLGAGTPLTILPRIPDYDADPSQIVMARPCDVAPALRTIDDALRGLPRAQFDYLWLITPHRFDPRLVQGMRPVWRKGADRLYRIEHSRLSPVPTSH